MSNYKIKLPNKIIKDQRLSYTAKKVAAAIYALHNVSYTVSVKSLCSKTQLSEATVYTALNALEHFKYIQRTRHYEYSKKLHRVVFGRNSYVCLVTTASDFTLVPFSIFSRKITAGTFALLLFLRYVAGNTNRAFPSYNFINKHFGMSRSWMRECLALLASLKMIYREHCKTFRGCFASNSYFLVTLLHSAPCAAQALSVCLDYSRLPL